MIKLTEEISHYEPLNETDLIAKGALTGRLTFIALENELFVDLDGGVVNPSVMKFLNDDGIIIDMSLADGSLKTKSLREGHWHLYIRLNSKTERRERVLYQALLGSDPNREYVTNKHEADLIAFFETPEEAKKVEKWREGFRLGVDMPANQEEAF